MLVERCAYDRALQIAKSVAEATKVAPSHMSGRHLGPVVSKQQWDKIQVWFARENACMVFMELGAPMYSQCSSAGVVFN
jgi:aldehyde dehydrogenase (NAD+)